MCLSSDFANALIDTYAKDGLFWKGAAALFGSAQKAGYVGCGVIKDVVNGINASLPPAPPHLPDCDDPDKPPPAPPMPPPPPPSPPNPRSLPPSAPGSGYNGGIPTRTPAAPKDPLVIDLNNDGVHFTLVGTPLVNFDIDNDGFKEAVSWVDPNDGLLALDKNGNGKIDDLSELIGQADKNGFDVLASYDGNSDGVIDAKDQIYNKLLVWRDANSSGRTESGELSTLLSRKIKSISLQKTDVSEDRGDTHVSHTSSVTFTDGGSSEVVAAWFATNQVLSYYDLPKGKSISTEAAKLPFLRGYGNIPDLCVSATLSKSLFDEVKTFVKDVWTLQTGKVLETFDHILFSWAGVMSIDPASRGAGIDARKVAFLEKLYDQSLAGSQLSTADADYFASTFEGIRDAWLVRFLSQVGGSAIMLADDPSSALAEVRPEDLLFASISLNPISNEVAFDPSVFLYRAQHLVGSDLNASLVKLHSAFTFVAGLRADLSNGSEIDFREELASSASGIEDRFLGAIFESLASGAELRIGSASGEKLFGADGFDLVHGGKGNDWLNGRDGIDLFIFNKGDGRDTIHDEDYGTGGRDTLLFGAGVSTSQVSVGFADDGCDLVLKIAGTTDQITIDDAVVNPFQRVEIVQFADGVKWTYANLLAKANTPTTGNDVMWGDSGINKLQGGKGNDWLNGRDGIDLFIFNKGDGRDTIHDEDYGTGGRDTLLFGAGISTSQVSVGFADDGCDLVLKIAGTTDQITIDDAVVNPFQRVEIVQFADGVKWTYANLLAKANTPTTGNDVMWGDSGINKLQGGKGNDWLNGRDGIDLFIFNKGDGRDTIHDEDYGTGGRDTLLFGAGISTSQVSVGFADDGCDLVLKIAGTTDQITIDDAVVNPFQRVEIVQFADGTKWYHADLLSMAV